MNLARHLALRFAAVEVETEPDFSIMQDGRMRARALEAFVRGDGAGVMCMVGHQRQERELVIDARKCGRLKRLPVMPDPVKGGVR